MSIIDEIRNMSPEERKELGTVLRDLEPKPESDVKQLGKPMIDPRTVNDYGGRLSAEEIYDQSHPLTLLNYGYSTSEVNAWTGKTVIRHYKNAEIDEMNLKAKKAWLAAKRKVFPNATLPDLDI